MMSIFVKIVEIVAIPVILAVAAYFAFQEKDWRLASVLLIALLVIYVLFLLLRRERTRLRESADVSRIPVRSSLSVDPSARDSMLKPEEDIVDKNNKYKLLSFRAVIDNTGTYRAYYRRVGINVSKSHISELPVKTATDCNVPYQEMEMKAFEVRRNRSLEIECFEDRSSVKKCRILLPDPVPPGVEFEIEWQFTWPYVMRRWGDFDGIDISRFPQGVDRLEYELVFEWALRSFILREIKDEKEKDASIQPTHETDEDGKHVYKWACDNPAADAYVFSYF